MSTMNVERSGWAAIAASIILLEAWTYAKQTDERNDTLSNTTRDLFKTQTRAGRFVVHALLGTSAAWFSYHVSSPAGSVSDRISLRGLRSRRKMIQSEHE